MPRATRPGIGKADASEQAPEQEGLYPIRHLCAQTGINAASLRARERRYGLVRPQRTAHGDRLYSVSDVARIRRIQQLLAGGIPVAQVHRVRAREKPASAIRDTEPRQAAPPEPGAPAGAPHAADPLAETLNAAAVRLDVDEPGQVYTRWSCAMTGVQYTKPPFSASTAVCAAKLATRPKAQPVWRCSPSGPAPRSPTSCAPRRAPAKGRPAPAGCRAGATSRSAACCCSSPAPVTAAPPCHCSTPYAPRRWTPSSGGCRAGGDPACPGAAAARPRPPVEAILAAGDAPCLLAGTAAAELAAQARGRRVEVLPEPPMETAERLAHELAARAPAAAAMPSGVHTR